MFKKNFISIFIISVAVYPLSLINQLFISYYFGTTKILDAYWNSFSIAMLAIIYVQPVKEILVNEYYILNKKKKDISKKYLFNQLQIWLLFTTFILIILFLTSSYLSAYLFQNQNLKYIGYISNYLKHFSLYLFLLTAVEIFGGILISQDRPIFQILPKLFLVLGSIIGFIFFVDQLNELVLVYGPTFGLFLLFLISIFYIRKNLSLQLVKPIKLSFKFLSKLKGLIFLNFITLIYLFYEKYVFSQLSTGLVSAYQYGKSLNDIPQNVIVMAIASSLWPLYLKEVNNHNKKHLFEMTINKIYILLLILTWITIIIILYSKHIIYLIYFRGQFDLNSLNLTSNCLNIIILSLIPMSIYSIISRAVYALKEIKWITISGLIGVFIGLSILLYSLFNRNQNLALYHFPVSQIISMFFIIFVFLNKIKIKFTFTEKIKFILFITKFIITLFIIYLFYPNTNFIMIPKTDLFIQLIYEIIVLSGSILCLWFVFNIINVDFIKKYYLR